MSKKRCKRKEVYLRVYSWARDALSFNVWCWKQSNKKKKNFFFLSKCICKGVNWGCFFWIIGKKCQRQMKWGKNRQGQSKKLGGNTIPFKSSFLCSTRNLFSIISIIRRRRKVKHFVNNVTRKISWTCRNKVERKKKPNKQMKIIMHINSKAQQLIIWYKWTYKNTL